MEKFFTSYKERSIVPGQSVQVYRNLKYKDEVVYSIRSVNTGLVLGHATHILLSRCAFVVSEAGRKRVIRTKRKNVHAWIEGCFGILHAGDDNVFSDGVHVNYNPYTNTKFELSESGEPIIGANLVYLNEKGVFASAIKTTWNSR